MDQDRFSSNSKLYIIGIISLVLSLAFFFFSMYILPFMVWHLNYDVPELILNLVSFFQNKYDYTERASRTLVWLLFFVPCIITGFISYYISNHIDNKILGLAPKSEEDEGMPAREIKEELKESASLGFKIIFLMILIVCLILLLQLFVQSTA